MSRIGAEYLTEWLRKHEERGRLEEIGEILEELKYCGEGVRINGRIILRGREQTVLGDNVHLNDNAFIDARAGLTIGANTHIGRNLVLLTTSHNYRGVCLPYDDTLIERPVWIGRNVWIGMNVCIAPGTRIGDGAIVGVGTTIYGDIPELAIVGSCDWKVLGMREKDHYDELEANGLYGGFNGRPL